MNFLLRINKSHIYIINLMIIAFINNLIISKVTKSVRKSSRNWKYSSQINKVLL